MSKIPFKSGYVAIIGLPNAGKSTLLNAIIGEKLAIVTSKPHTTREKMAGIFTTDKAQIVFLDTPGIHHSDQMMNQYMINEAKSVIKDADVLLFLVAVDRELNRPYKKFIEEVLKKYRDKKPILMAINKTDISLNDQKITPQIIDEVFPEIPYLPISALDAIGIDDLLEVLMDHLPVGPMYYPNDQISTQNLRDIVKEFIREKAFELLKQELPYSLAVEIEEFHEEPTIIKIRANIVVETESQKFIVIGKRGAMIKQIGIKARSEIESFLDQKLFLDLHVKVDRKWSKKPTKMAKYGYKLKKG